MAITFKEVQGRHNVADIPIAHQHNIEELLKRINILRAAYGKPLRVTSGYRSMQDHLRIYSQKGITDKSKIPMGSQHLYGCAVDFADPKGELQAWILANPQVIEQADLYLEDFKATKGWVHCQWKPFRSYKAGGTRFFMP